MNLLTYLLQNYVTKPAALKLSVARSIANWFTNHDEKLQKTEALAKNNELAKFVLAVFNKEQYNQENLTNDLVTAVQDYERKIEQEKLRIKLEKGQTALNKAKNEKLELQKNQSNTEKQLIKSQNDSEVEKTKYLATIDTYEKKINNLEATKAELAAQNKKYLDSIAVLTATNQQLHEKQSQFTTEKQKHIEIIQNCQTQINNLEANQSILASEKKEYLDIIANLTVVNKQLSTNQKHSAKERDKYLEIIQNSQNQINNLNENNIRLNEEKNKLICIIKISEHLLMNLQKNNEKILTKLKKSQEVINSMISEKQEHLFDDDSEDIAVIPFENNEENQDVILPVISPMLHYPEMLSLDCCLSIEQSQKQFDEDSSSNSSSIVILSPFENETDDQTTFKNIKAPDVPTLKLDAESETDSNSLTNFETVNIIRGKNPSDNKAFFQKISQKSDFLEKNLNYSQFLNNN